MYSIEDLLKFVDVALPNTKPTWYTTNKVVLSTKAFKLREFGTGDRDDTPVLVLPPQAGHSSHIADYGSKQSIIETLLKSRTESKVYCIEWLPSTNDRKYETIADLVCQVLTAVKCIADQVHLVGLCQGGWLASIFTAMYQHRVTTLTCIAAPIDFHADGGIIYDTVTSLGIVPYKLMVLINNGIMSGKNMLAGWKMMNFIDRYVNDYLKIILSIEDDYELKRIRKFREWYEYTQDLSGAWYLEAVEDLFLNNKLVKDELFIDGRVVRLSNIKCPIVMIAGEKDDITLPQQLFALGRYSSSKNKLECVIPKAGHVGCFMGKNSQKYLAESVKYLDSLIFKK